MLPSYASFERQSECQTNPSTLHSVQPAPVHLHGQRNLPPDERLDEGDPPTISQSLRGQVKKWLAPALNTPVKLTRHGNQNLQCVRAELSSATHSLIIFFFRHPDGAWRVFPPRPIQPTMRTCVMAAQSTFAID
jgi:hypothetical protein